MFRLRSMRLVTGKHSLCACVCCANCVKEDEDGRAPSRSSCSNTDNASEAAGGIMTYRMCTAPVFCLLAMALVTAAVSTIVMIVAIASDSWEHIDYHSAKLSAIAVKDDKTDYEMVSAISVMNDDEGFYKVVLRPKNAQIIANSSEQVLYFRSVYGGIWRMCDRIKESTRKSNDYQSAKEDAQYLKFPCFNYIGLPSNRKDDLDTKGLWLIRMQNSAASCVIVSLLCLFAAFITGVIGLLQKQVASLLITGIMYIVSGVFMCFTLVIIHTKIAWSQDKCYSLDTFSAAGHVQNLCIAGRSVTAGWSVPVAWVSFCSCLLTFICWIFLYRRLGAESAQQMI